jgi:mannose-6-phosphate isomerase-like protein (cupin superfamily)
MTHGSDLSRVFVHLRDGGDAEAVKITRSFWTSSAVARGKYDRIVGAFAFASDEDLHASMQEVHPSADEVLFLVSGALDVLVDDPGGERRISLEAGQFVIVPRGVWHRLVMRQPGKLIFINSRTGMLSRDA